jgi:hypothetical protein
MNVEEAAGWIAWATRKPMLDIVGLLEQMPDEVILDLGFMMSQNKQLNPYPNPHRRSRVQRFMCLYCGEWFDRARIAGRRPLYCCEAHKAAAYRQRKKVRRKLGLE